jgi:hypothetical protein
MSSWETTSYAICNMTSGARSLSSTLGNEQTTSSRACGGSAVATRGQDGENEANLNDGEGGWMSVGSAGPLLLKGDVCAIPTFKAVRRERAEDEGDQGAASSVDIGVEATWATHRGAEPAMPWARTSTYLVGSGGTHERVKRRRRHDLLISRGGRRRHPLIRRATRRLEPVAGAPKPSTPRVRADRSGD